MFLDGEVRKVADRTFSRCLVSAAYMRLVEGAETHRQLTVDVTAMRAIKTELYAGSTGED